MKQLEQVLADAREDAAVLRRRGHTRDAELLERFCEDVAAAAHEYLAWLTESEAELRSGRSGEWLRARFPDWERDGHARRDGRRRYYRMLIVPRRADVPRAYQDGRTASAA